MRFAPGSSDRRLDLFIEPLGGAFACGRRDLRDGAARCVDGGGQLLRHIACPLQLGALVPDEDERRGLDRIVQVAQQRRHRILGGEAGEVPANHHSPIGEERHGLRRVHQRCDGPVGIVEVGGLGHVVQRKVARGVAQVFAQHAFRARIQ